MTATFAAALCVAVSAVCVVTTGSAAAPGPARVRDRLWIWAHDAAFYNGGAGLPGGIGP